MRLRRAELAPGGAPRGLLHAASGAACAGLLMTWVAALGCSTVDRGPVDECQDDSDCGTGLVCSLAQGNICVPEELPPRAAIGFDIKEGDLRVELTGCDPEVTRELGGSELRVQRRSALVRDYELSAAIRRSVGSCGPNECAGECDEQALTCTEATDADFTVTMASRLGLSELRNKKSYLSETEGGEVSPPTAFTWPVYEADVTVDPLAHAARVLDVTPTGDVSSNSPYRRVLAEDAPEQLESTGTLRCQRGLYGTEGAVSVLDGMATPVVGATIEFRYADAIATPSTVLGSGPSCSEDQPCPPGWACNVQGSCGLDLRETLAGTTSSTEELLGGYPPAWVYTYCEGILAPLDPLFREFTVTVTPPADSGLPTVLYSLDQGFIDPPTENSARQVQVDKILCLPDWEPPQPVEFRVVGEPVLVASTELGEYRCCSTECLPEPDPSVEPSPPPAIDSCSGFQRIRFETRWFNDDLMGWLFASCAPTASYPDGSNGRFRTEITACEDGPCSVALTPGEATDATRTYSVAITQPQGSLFRSQRLSVQLTPETTELPDFELQPRVLLRGRIDCASPDNCSGENAAVYAERLRVDTDDNDLPGPFFFETRVDQNGEYLLPLDPGVYVLTALPAVGQPGAPAPFSILDLREGSDAVEIVDGVPNAELSMQLDDGVLVRVALDGFEVSTGVTPIDVGSWKAQDDFPADLDLNDPQTCYVADSTGRLVRRGCTIRRLRPTDAPISLLSSKRAQFTARSRGAATCE